MSPMKAVKAATQPKCQNTGLDPQTDPQTQLAELKKIIKK